MKFLLIFAILGVLLGVYLVEENRLIGAGLGLVGGSIIGFALRSFPRDEPKDGAGLIDDDHCDH